MNKKVILFVGGAASQCHIIEIAKSMNYGTICVDYDERCQGKEIADEFYKISTSDVEEIVKLGKKKAITAVVSTQSDLGLKTASCVAEKLGLQGLSEKTIEMFTNKVNMRMFLSANGYNCPQFKKCYDLEQVKQAMQEIPGDVVIKPLDSQGSRGVQIISEIGDNKGFQETFKYSKSEAAVIVEEYLGSEEYTVEGYMRYGRHTTLAISRKQHYRDYPCVSNELFYNWEDEQELNELAEMHNEMLEKTGLEYGITHSEYLKKDGKFYLVEFTARGGGSHIASEIIPYVSGIDVERELLLDTLELSRDQYILSQRRKCAILKFFEFREGKIKQIIGLEQIEKIPGVLYISLQYKPGDYIRAVKDDTNRHGFYIAGADTEKQLSRIMKEIENGIKIVYE